MKKFNAVNLNQLLSGEKNKERRFAKNKSFFVSKQQYLASFIY